MYSGPCILRPPIQPEKYGRKLKVVLKMEHPPIQPEIQWSLYFKTTHWTKKMWSYIAGGLKIKVI